MARQASASAGRLAAPLVEGNGFSWLQIAVFIVFVAKIALRGRGSAGTIAPFFRFIGPCPSGRMGKRAAACRSQKGCISVMSALHAKLSRSNLLFPLALVLFEFAVYICNDMVQPAMLAVTREFLVDASWVPASMTAFLLGGALLSWLTGPLSDRIGRRPVLLFGVAYFTVTCLATYLVSSIEAFIALRLLQGIGLCFINAVATPRCRKPLKKRPRSRSPR